jgi:hypothetical protein
MSSASAQAGEIGGRTSVSTDVDHLPIAFIGAG